mmetsp:Transcript_70/g.153  ORF Transcript_70/g.153 Transcript_70/m.153 type:complete len:246 (-) Transcript_70:599-1336(-)
MPSPEGWKEFSRCGQGGAVRISQERRACQRPAGRRRSRAAGERHRARHLVSWVCGEGAGGVSTGKGVADDEHGGDEKDESGRRDQRCTTDSPRDRRQGGHFRRGRRFWWRLPRNQRTPGRVRQAQSFQHPPLRAGHRRLRRRDGGGGSDADCRDPICRLHFPCIRPDCQRGCKIPIPFRRSIQRGGHDDTSTVRVCRARGPVPLAVPRRLLYAHAGDQGRHPSVPQSGQRPPPGVDSRPQPSRLL